MLVGHAFGADTEAARENRLEYDAEYVPLNVYTQDVDYTDVSVQARKPKNLTFHENQDEWLYKWQPCTNRDFAADVSHHRIIRTLATAMTGRLENKIFKVGLGERVIRWT